MDEDILELVALNDFTYEVDVEDDESLLATSGDFSQRPTTADKAEVCLFSFVLFRYLACLFLLGGLF